MIKVLIVAGALYIGGAERVCRNIGFYADPNVFQTDYIVFGPEEGAYEAELRQKGCRIIHLEHPNQNHLSFYFSLKRLITGNRYDVVHCHTMFNSGLVLLAAKQCRVPIRIAHSHSIRGPEPRNGKKRFYENSMRKLIQRTATHCIGCGRDAGNWLFGEEFFSKKGILLLNGIDLDLFAFSNSQRLEIRQQYQLSDCFVIGHVGHLLTVKNQIFLIRLMPELIKRRPNVRLLLLGEGEDRPMLEGEIQRLGLKKTVIMTGNVGNVNEILSAMDVFAFPSLYEGMPLSIIEAQANGLPIVISDKVPRDVFLTDLIVPLSLEDAPAKWADALLSAERTTPDQYLSVLQNSGFSVHNMLRTIYSIYQGQ